MEDIETEQSCFGKIGDFFNSIFDLVTKRFVQHLRNWDFHFIFGTQLFRIPLQLKISGEISRKIFSHYFDIIRDVLFVINIGLLLKEGSFFLKWVRLKIGFKEI